MYYQNIKNKWKKKKKILVKKEQRDRLYYIDFNKNKFLNIDDYYKKINYGIVETKETLRAKKLLVFDNNKILKVNTLNI